MRYAYAVELVPEPDGGYVVHCPDVPEALTQGETREEALAEAADALAAALAGYVAARQPVPEPNRVPDGSEVVALPALTAAKLALYTAMREQGISNVALARRLGVTEAAARRLVDPDHSSRIEGVERALAALGRRLVVEAA